jgi:hypothetical protein
MADTLSTNQYVYTPERRNTLWARAAPHHSQGGRASALMTNATEVTITKVAIIRFDVILPAGKSRPTGRCHPLTGDPRQAA